MKYWTEKNNRFTNACTFASCSIVHQYILACQSMVVETNEFYLVPSFLHLYTCCDTKEPRELPEKKEGKFSGTERSVVEN
jgi:hypothetical protein